MDFFEPANTCYFLRAKDTLVLVDDSSRDRWISFLTTKYEAIKLFAKLSLKFKMK